MARTIANPVDMPNAVDPFIDACVAQDLVVEVAASRQSDDNRRTTDRLGTVQVTGRVCAKGTARWYTFNVEFSMEFYYNPDTTLDRIELSMREHEVLNDNFRLPAKGEDVLKYWTIREDIDTTVRGAARLLAAKIAFAAV